MRNTPVNSAPNQDDARSDPMDFYHGMAVRSGGEDLVLCGPQVSFVPGEESQLSLFS